MNKIKQFAIPLAIIALVLLTIYKVFGEENIPTPEEIAQEQRARLLEEQTQIDRDNLRILAYCNEYASGAKADERQKAQYDCYRTQRIPDIVIPNITTGTASGTPVSSAPERKEVNESNSIPLKDTGLDILQKEICKASKESPLCSDTAMLIRFKGIADKQGVPLRFAIGVTYAESHIGVNFKPTNCSTHNNWAGLKGYKYDPTKWSKATKLPDKEGCWLYKFESPEQGFTSLVNTLKDYQLNKCSTPECVSKNFVGTNKETKRDWSWRVRLFFNP